MWAANEMWNSSPIETFNFDVSTYMNSTAEAVIKSTTFKIFLDVKTSILIQTLYKQRV